jgi:hypothetical protein
MGVDHRPNEISPVPSPTLTTSRSLYAGEFFGAAYPGSSRLPWPSLSLTSSALPCSPLGANLSALQDSLHVAGCGFALLSQEVTTLQHLRSPGSTGCLLRGCLTITATGLSPASRRQLSGHTMRGLGGLLPLQHPCFPFPSSAASSSHMAQLELSGTKPLRGFISVCSIWLGNDRKCALNCL